MFINGYIDTFFQAHFCLNPALGDKGISY